MKDFSVLISIYKKENPVWFREALDSVFAQTLQPYEIVLVEDGPLTPELYEVIDEYQSKHPIFNIVKNEKNLGLGLALRKGVEASKTDFLMRMDTDDIIPPYRFDRQMAAMKDNIDVVSCWSMAFSESLDNVIAIKKRPEFHPDIVKRAKRRSPLCHAACFMRKSAVLKAGNYQPRLYYEDYHLWVRMILTGCKFYNIQEVLYFVRTNPDQLARRRGLEYLKNELKILYEFYTMGFYSLYDLLINDGIRIIARMAPPKIIAFVFKKIWNYS